MFIPGPLNQNLNVIRRHLFPFALTPYVEKMVPCYPITSKLLIDLRYQ